MLTITACLNGIGLFNFGDSELLFNITSLTSLTQPEEDGYAEEDNSKSNTNAYTGLSSAR